MRTLAAVHTLALLTACSSPSPSETTSATEAPATSSTQAEPAAPAPAVEQTAPEVPVTTATASGTVEAIDPAAKTITIAHGPVEALKWPAMTMTFKAPDVDLTALEKGDHVEFDLAASGMDGTVTKITKH